MSQRSKKPPVDYEDYPPVKALKAVEAIRTRPAMYVGDTGSNGLHHILFECIDNSLDETLAGYCSEIHCRIFEDGSVFIDDDGRGILAENIPGEENRTWLESFLTELHFRRGWPYEKVLSDKYGLGLVTVNALSESLDAAVHQKGRMWTISFERGDLKYPLMPLCKTTRTGTSLQFKPDSLIFGETTFDFELIRERFRELACLFPGVKLNLADDRIGKEASFHSPNGLADYVRHLNQDRDPLVCEVFQHEVEYEGARIGVAFQPTAGFEPRVEFFVNAGRCNEGTHIKGFRVGLKHGLSQYAQSHGLILYKAPTIDHYYEGITAVISVWLEDPHYEGPTRFKLGNVEMARSVARVVRDGIEIWAQERPDCVQQMIEKAVLSAELDGM